MKHQPQLKVMKPATNARAHLDFLRIRHLRFLVRLRELGSLVAVADQLSITPSAASMMLREIENLIGTQLFRRAGRGMVATAEGDVVVGRIRTILGEVGALGSALERPSAPYLRIGAFPHTTMTVLPPIVSALTTQRPSWRLHLRDESAEVLLQRLIAAEIDLVVGRMPRSMERAEEVIDLAQRPLYQGSLSIVCRSQHPLARKRKLGLSDLIEWPWVLPGVESTTRIALIETFMREGISPPIPTIESPSFFYSLSLVVQGDFLSCCANAAALKSAYRLTVLPVAVEGAHAPVSLIWRRTSAVAERAIALLARVNLAAFGPQT